MLATHSGGFMAQARKNPEAPTHHQTVGIRVAPHVLAKLDQEAEKQGRSRVKQLEKILEERYKK
jgi:hypothetical protein